MISDTQRMQFLLNMLQKSMPDNSELNLVQDLDNILDSIRSEPTRLLERRYELKVMKEEYYNFKKEAEAKIKEQNERIIDLMTLLREAQMGDKDTNPAICQTDISGKIIAYTNVEGIAAAAIDLKIFASAFGGTKGKDDDKKKKKKTMAKKNTMKQNTASFEGSQEENSVEEDDVLGASLDDVEEEDGPTRQQKKTQRAANGVTVSDKFTGDALRIADAGIDNDNNPLSNWNGDKNKVPKSRMESYDLENTVKREQLGEDQAFLINNGNI